MTSIPANSKSNSETTQSGITTSADGARIIPASMRADGSKRREIRVRPGYRPPEDVEVYKNRTAEAWKNRGSGGVPGAEGLKDDHENEEKSPVANKNAKRREARKRAKAAAAEDGGNTPPVEAANPTADENAPEVSAQTEQDKKVKRLKKKLREARELQAKRDKGEGLLQEQFDKVIKIRELMRELAALGIADDEQIATPLGYEQPKKA